MIKSNEEKSMVKFDGKQANNFLETFYYKKFAMLFVKYDGNLMKAYKETFGAAGEEIEKLFGKANTILEKPEVQSEIKKYLPEREDIYAVYRKALAAQTPMTIDWGAKLKAAETMLKVSGDLGGDGEKITNNVVMVIEK